LSAHDHANESWTGVEFAQSQERQSCCAWSGKSRFNTWTTARTAIQLRADF